MIGVYFVISAIITWNTVFPEQPPHIHAEEYKIIYGETVND